MPIAMSADKKMQDLGPFIGKASVLKYIINDELEVEATIRFVAVDLSNGDSIDFRLYLNAADDFTTKGNPTAGGYTQTANATITKAGASFQPAWALRSNQLL